MNPYNDTAPKKSQVKEMFNRIAPRYDALNSLLSLGRDAAWRRKFAEIAATSAPQNVLDVASGTGEVAFALARRLPEVRVLGTDLSESMIDVAQGKCRGKGFGDRLRFAAGDAEKISADSRSFDLLTVAFGVRNFQNRKAALNEFYRVVRHGGALMIMEFSEPKGKFFAPLYRFYRRRIIPLVGRLLSDGEAYRYLAESIAEFCSEVDLREEIRAAGFADIETTRLSRSIATIYLCKKS